MQDTPRPKLGLALSGSGNRTSFYVGFLEIFKEKNIPVDYIAASSGGSLVAAAFACGTLPEFKKKILELDKESLGKYFARSKGKGGYFSLDLLEEEICNYTKGMTFEEVRPLMGFVAVNIQTGEKVLLCMGDIARAVRISCTLPGIFVPVTWGNKTLVDGGLLTMVPGDVLRGAGVDVTVGVNMRGTKHIFTDRQVTAKKVYNFFKKILFLDEIEHLFNHLFGSEEADSLDNPGFFEVIGKSLDLAILANKTSAEQDESCDLMIVPNLPRLKQANFTTESIKYYYEMGRKCALENLPKIEEMVKRKEMERVAVKV